MIMTSTQYLQVPKILPHRKGRSRSKSRSHETVSVEKVQVFPSKTYDSSQCVRFTSPPAPAQKRAQSPASPVQTTMAVAIPRALSPVSNAHAATLQTRKYTPPAELDLTVRKLDKPHTPSPPISPRKISTPTALRHLENPQIDLNGGVLTLDDGAKTPPIQTSLRSKIIGAWKLESYIAHPTPESRIQRPTYPMTRNVTGFIMYTPDGYMSAQMLIPGQQSFKRGEGEEPQWAEAAKRCFAYCGPYYITDEGPGREEVLRHTFQVCNLPGWIGDVQVRTHKFEEDGQVLVLGSEEPTEIKGDKRRPVLKWRRARDNSNGVPPPPTPSIKVSGPGEP